MKNKLKTGVYTLTNEEGIEVKVKVSNNYIFEVLEEEIDFSPFIGINLNANTICIRNNNNGKSLISYNNGDVFVTNVETHCEPTKYEIVRIRDLQENDVYCKFLLANEIEKHFKVFDFNVIRKITKKLNLNHIVEEVTIYSVYLSEDIETYIEVFDSCDLNTKVIRFLREEKWKIN